MVAIDLLEEAMQTCQFVRCGPTQPESSGWVPPRGNKSTVLAEMVGGQLILKLCIERKAVPSQVVKNTLEAQLDKVEADTGRRPKGKKAKELKEDIVHGLAEEWQSVEVALEVDVPRVTRLFLGTLGLA